MLKMNQNYYMDSQTLVAGHTLIRLTSYGNRMRVPSVFGNISAETVGSGALTLGEEVCELRFDSGYVEWKDGSVNCPRSLTQVFFPETAEMISRTALRNMYYTDPDLYMDRALGPEVFHEIGQNAPRAGEGRLISSALLERKILGPVRDLMLNLGPAAEIRMEMGFLFFGLIPGESGSAWYSGTIFDPRSCYDFHEAGTAMEEYTAVMRMIRNGDAGWHDPDAEKQADLDIRFGRAQMDRNACGKVSIAVLEEPEQDRGSDGKYHMRFHLSRNVLFFPSLWPIRHQGKDWWLYSRNYLTGSPQRPYRREEVGVFNREGLITERKIMEDVYAKYRLLSVL